MNFAARRTDTVDRATNIAIPVGMAVITWLVFLIGLGLVLRLESLSIFNLVPFAVVGLLLWPLAQFAPWRVGVADRVRTWANQHRSELVVMVGLIALTALPAIELTRPIVGILRLPYRNFSGVFFGVSVFYRERFGATVGRLLFEFGRWYLELIWLFVLATAITVGIQALTGGRGGK